MIAGPIKTSRPYTPVKAHVLRDSRLAGWKEQIAGRWHYRDLVADPNWRHGWISFDTVTWSAADRGVYCGLNSLDGDLLYRFDPPRNEFACLNTQRWTDRFDSKIHRTLLHNPLDGCFYMATSPAARCGSAAGSQGRQTGPL